MKCFGQSKPKLIASSLVALTAISTFAAVLAKDSAAHIPSTLEADKSTKFDLAKWRTWTNDGIAALEQKKYDSAEQFFQAAVREASKAATMSTFMIDSLVHTAEVYRLTDRKQEAKETFDQALSLVSMLKAEKCPLCKSSDASIPMIYGPHSEELEEWAKAKAAQLGDFKEVTNNKRKNRPVWYCKQCETGY